MFKNSGWIVPGILLGGALLLIGAITSGNGTMVVVTFLLVAVAMSAARSDDGKQRERQRGKRR
ncbi:hypothetical protein [Catenulispora subtropica]|uniref:Uncharacterized protein n=1 Tax=Catenulispora subtropica TaxID=450798 RepID=A0ABN2T910_9ACTN